VKNFIYCAVTPDCDDRIGLARLRAKPARITAFPCHLNLDAMSESPLPYHGRPQRLAADDLAVNDKAQVFFWPSQSWVAEVGVFRACQVMGSLVAYRFLAYVLTRITLAHSPRRAAIALLAGLVLLIGFSRIYLGIHFMSDVIGGYAAGAVWLALCII
jgi:hypothetical protein